jgi:hypothetical protein
MVSVHGIVNQFCRVGTTHPITPTTLASNAHPAEFSRG